MTKLNKNHWRIITAVYMILLLGVSLNPMDRAGETISIFKEIAHNAAHVPAYAVLTFFLLKALLPKGRRPFRRAFCIAVAYGALLEIFQGFVPSRFPSGMDVGLNTAGALGALWLAREYRGRSSKT